MANHQSLVLRLVLRSGLSICLFFQLQCRHILPFLFFLSSCSSTSDSAKRDGNRKQRWTWEDVEPFVAHPVGGGDGGSSGDGADAVLWHKAKAIARCEGQVGGPLERCSR